MAFSTWLLFVVTMAALFLTPGATTLSLSALTLRYGRQGLWFLIPGISLADLIYITAALSGVSALILTFPSLYLGLKIAGLFYVAYLAWGLWYQTPESHNPTMDLAAGGGAAPHSPGWHLTLKMFLTTLSNPKGFVFMFGLMPQFIPEETQLSFDTAAVMTVTFVGLSALNATLWGLLADQVLGRLAQWRHVGKLSALILLMAVSLIWISDLIKS